LTPGTYDRHQFGTVRELETLCASVNIHTDQFLTLLDMGRHDSLQKVDKSFSMISLCEEEIDSIVDLLDIDSILVRSVLQDQLLEEEESTLMRDLLSDLDRGSPSIGCVTLGTV
jgi:hypothetical protein